MCYVWLLTLIALMAINVTSSKSIHGKDETDEINNEVPMYNLTVAQRPWAVYSCKEPQPRAYILPDLLKSTYLKAEETVNLPLYIVLKRCDVHTGCCASNWLTCAPIPSKIYYEKVEIEIESLMTNSKRKEWIQVEQHGECTCMNTTTQQWQQLEKQCPKIQKFLSKGKSSS